MLVNDDFPARVSLSASLDRPGSELFIHNCELCLITVVVANAAAIWTGGDQDAGVVALKASYNGKEVLLTPLSKRGMHGGKVKMWSNSKDYKELKKQMKVRDILPS